MMYCVTAHNIGKIPTKEIVFRAFPEDCKERAQQFFDDLSVAVISGSKIRIMFYQMDSNLQRIMLEVAEQE